MPKKEQVPDEVADKTVAASSVLSLEAPALEEAETSETLAKYDLTSKVSPFLDRHMIIQIMEFLKGMEYETRSGEKIGMYKLEHIMRAQMDLLNGTYMIDLIEDKYKELGEEAPEDLTERREKVLTAVSTAQTQVYDLLLALEDKDKLAEIKDKKSLVDVCATLGLENDVFDKLITYARAQYQCGNYEMSQKLLHHFRNIVLNCSEQELRHHQSMLWGQLASFLLSSGAAQTEAETSQTDSDAAAVLVHVMSDLLDEPALVESMGKKGVLLQRTWLLHWALFLIFVRQEQGSPSQTKLLEWFLDEKNLSVMSISCPHLYRYVGACLILNSKRLKHLLNSSGSPVWVLKHEKHGYSDPITDFLLALYCDVDFDEAQRQLLRCRVVCKGDFFLSRWWDDHFEENARLLIFETYCRIHQCINLEMIASKLNMDPQAAELWIVKLIQNAKLDARIDSAKKRVVMSKAPPNVYQQVIEKTKNLAFRSTMLLSNLEKKERHQPRDHR